MVDYNMHQGRDFRPNQYGHASNFQREAAFSSIFGADPPPGRTQTMTSRSATMPPERAQTMSLQTLNHMAQPPPQSQQQQPQQPPPQPRPSPGGYGAPMLNGYAPRQRLEPIHTQSQPHLQQQQQYPPQQQYPQQQQQHHPQQHQQHQQHLQYQQHQQYQQSQQHQQHQQHQHQQQQPQQHQQQQQPPPQHHPQIVYPDRRPYPPPQRVDPRYSAPEQPSANRSFSGSLGMNSDPYRSRTMASMPGPAMFPGSNNYPPSAASAFRHGPYQQIMARTTAQGRVVPERHDERAMSMTSYSYDRDHTQTMSGRIIPNRKRDSGDQRASVDSTTMTTYSPTVADPRNMNGRTPSQASGRSQTISTTSTIVASPDRIDAPNRTSLQKSSSNNTAAGMVYTAQRRAPLIYPALLSRVADVFRERIQLGERSKNELSYKNAFTGLEAVDLISYIIKTNDRNLALLLGRALDAQKLFHDVTYDHRLRDSSQEVYQFRETLVDDATDVNGVFTLLTECYSPTCTRDRLCYSIACPRRLEQQARLNLKLQPGLKREESRSSLHGDNKDEQKLWINTVSKEVADSVGEREKKRQEVICEIMYTERDFVKDLEYLRDFWMKPLRSVNPASPSPIPEHRREKFIRTVFSNCLDVLAVNSNLAKELTRRQDENPVVRCVGDIFLRFVPRFEPFIKYGASQLYGKYEFEKERASNPAFSKFVDETERLKESRKLELNGYLTKPTTRLARYPLLLENVLKYTADGNSDKQDIPRAIQMIRDVLSRVNVESGKAENHFNLMQLNQQLKFRQGEYVDLKLTEESRQLLFKGALKKSPTDNSDIHAYLFDHAFLLVRVKVANKREEMKVHRKTDDPNPKAGIAKRPSSNLIAGAKTTLMDPNAKQIYPVTFKHLGKGGYELTLYASTHVQRRKWVEFIENQQKALRSRSNFFTKTDLCDNFFTYSNRVNCLVPIDGGRKLVYGTDNGIYVSDRRPREASSKPRRVLDVPNVSQVEVLEEYQLLLVLTNKNLYSYPLETLDASDAQSALAKRPGRKIGHASFFRTGVCLGRHLVCCVKTSTPSSTIKVYEPMETMVKGKKKPAFSKMFQGGQDALKPFKEIFVPSEATSIHFLRSKLCVGCAAGFEVVSLETLDNQSLLDQADTSLDFVARRENVKAIHIERLNGEFLLNYNDFSFFVNRNGWRARPDWQINWEGQPQAFALSYPYILAFEPSFIEIRNVETTALAHILTGRNIRMLHSSTREILYAFEGNNGEDVVASLDFWSRAQT